jgi:site-specific DNA-methyltransferase (adenine-specific)
MHVIKSEIKHGDCAEVLQNFSDNTFDLIVTSPPYADRRKCTYGGTPPDKYVEWFLPRSAQFLRVLKPTGTFVLNIKEKAENGERHTFVLELILALRKQGWLWTEEFIWHKKIAILENGQIGFVMPGNVVCNLINPVISK